MTFLKLQVSVDLFTLNNEDQEALKGQGARRRQTRFFLNGFLSSLRDGERMGSLLVYAGCKVIIVGITEDVSHYI